MLRDFARYCMVVLMAMGHHSVTFAAETPIDDEISRLDYINQKYEKYLIDSDRLYQDHAAIDYLQRIMNKLYPEYVGEFSVLIINSTEINASAVDTGRIYVNIGLLAKADNEAQIASVLAHEGAHATANHQLIGMENRKFVLTGTDFYGTEKTRAFLSDYSIENEQEADDEGFKRLVAADYDPKEAVKMFQLMADEAKIRYQQDTSLYSSHPKLVDRINHFKKLSAGHSGTISKKLYTKYMSAIKLECLKRNIANYQFRSVLLDLETNNHLFEVIPQAWFYFGEAYRQRAGDNDNDSSETAYLKVIELVPEFAPAYRALGVLYMKKQNKQKAIQYFDRYIAMAPNAQDRLYIDGYYKVINNMDSAQ